jgi:nucleoside triphosphate pyrophosphatase
MKSKSVSRTQHPQPKLILASSSPRRAGIMRNAGFTFEVRATQIDESLRPRESATAHVQRLATAKARAALEHAKRKKSAVIVIGADTVVVAQGRILGKPRNANDARRMLRLLSGRVHQVLTGVSVLRVSDRKELHHIEATRVHFAKLSNEDIDGYIATGEPFDKAGAYGIQAIGGRFIDWIEGCYFNVMGLPLARVWVMLGQLAVRDGPKARLKKHPRSTRRSMAHPTGRVAGGE